MKEQIISDFDQLSNFEDTDLWNHNNHYFEFLKSKICQNWKSALEVGCGIGNFCAILYPLFENVIGLDISPDTIKKAKKCSDFKNVQYEIGDYLQIKYPENSFYLIVSIATVHHFSLLNFLRKAKSEIKSGGQVVILDLYRPKTFKDRLTEILAVF
nr:class I SAM-dependent methyltransferase [Thermoflexibacter sp.]